MRVHVVPATRAAKHLVAEHAYPSEPRPAGLILMEIEARIAGNKRVRVPRYIRGIRARREKLVITAFASSQHKRTGHDLLLVSALVLLNARAAVRRFTGIGYRHHFEPALWGAAIGANPVIRDVGPPRARFD